MDGVLGHPEGTCSLLILCAPWRLLSLAYLYPYFDRVLKSYTSRFSNWPSLYMPLDWVQHFTWGGRSESTSHCPNEISQRQIGSEFHCHDKDSYLRTSRSIASKGDILE